MNFDIKFIKKNKKFIFISLGVIVVGLIMSLLMSNASNRLEEKELADNGDVNIGSLVINEIMSSNDGAYASSDGTVSDWIELYNGNDYEVNLKGYGLSDRNKEAKWAFPEVTIGPKSYLVVYLVGETKEGLYANFKLSSRGDESIFLTKPNGKVVDAVDVTALNKNEVIARDLEGHWFTSKTITPGFPNTKEGYNEYLNSITDNGSKIKISEILPKNDGNFQNSYNNFSGYIEITNEGNDVVNLKDYCISNSYDAPFKKRLPQIFIGAHDTVVIYMGKYDNNDNEYYSGFNLENKTGVAILTNNNGKIIDRVDYKDVPNGIAYVKENGAFYKSVNISPGYENSVDGINKFNERKLKNKNDLIINEVMNNNSSYLPQNGNQYYDWIEVKNNSNHEINLKDYYLSTSSNNYGMYNLPDKVLKAGELCVIIASGDVNLSNNSYNHANFKISEIESLYLTKNDEVIDSMVVADVPLGYSMGRGNNNGFYYFSSPTPGSNNGNGISAVAFIPSLSINPGVYNNIDGLKLEINGNQTVYYTLDGSTPTTSSYVYKEPINISKTTVVKAASYQNGKVMSPIVTGSYVVNENHTIPVLSVSLNPSSFNSVQANNWDTNLEASAYAELYENGKSFSIPCGFKLFGGSTRGMAKKSFALKFRKKYGASSLKYQVFENRDYSEFDTLVIRSGSQDSDFAFMRDSLMTSLVDGVTNLKVQAYKSVILYINGNYWGVYNIREKVDDDFIANNFNVDGSKANIVRIDNNISTGSIDDYRNVVNYLNTHDMSIDSNYEYIKTKLNIESFADFWAAESWVTNNDIINTRFYSHPDIDNGRINMIFYDLDYAMWNVRNNYFTFSVQPEGMSDFNVSTEMMRSLIKSKKFRSDYLDRISYQYKNVWTEERVINKINEIYDKLKPEMERNQKRWGMTMKDWEDNVNKLRDYAKNRGTYYKSTAKSFFNLTNDEMKKYFGD